MPRSPLLLLVSLAASVPGCQPTDAASPASVTSDSAGIVIVTNHRPQWTEGEGWRLGPEPVVDLGGWDVEPEYDFQRIAGALVLDDGTIVVAEAPTNEIRFYDETGNRLYSVGGEGQGPGEYESLSFIQRMGDSLVVADGRMRRLSVLGLDGDFGRSFLLLPSDSAFFPRPFGVLSGGRLLVRGFYRRDGPPEEGVVEELSPYFWYSLGGNFGGSLGAFSYGDNFVVHIEDGYVVTVPLFGERGVLLASGASLYAGLGKTAEVKRYDGYGELERVVRFVRPLRPVTEADHSRAVAERMAGIPPERREWNERVYGAMPRMEAMPIWDGLLVDSEGNLWLSAFEEPEDTESVFLVFDPEGVWLGSVAGPAGFEPIFVNQELMVGSRRDEDDVRHLLVYNLLK